MAENTWRKIEVGNIWNYKEEGKDTEFIGIYLSKDEHIGENDSIVYNFKTADGSVIGVWGSTVLDVRLKNLEVGEEVKIVYLGLKPSEKRKGKSFHDFEVWHRMPEFRKTSDGIPLPPTADDIPPIEEENG
ncbi:MAG TPA: hypothetical protein VFF49_04535 [Thermodesulfobacteriota bacterium]|nr:hypothetical protein [Thermodesulfobacteriota bacterium]